jgi:hypothetical protein
MAATDSTGLAKETSIAGRRLSSRRSPARALEEARRLADAGGSIELGVLENQVLWGIDGTG